MKQLKNLLLVGFLLLLANCSDDETKPSVAEEQMAKLKGKWKATSVKVDNDEQEDFDGFVLTISPVEKTEKLLYVIENNPPSSPWTSVTTGALTVNADNPTELLIREDDVNIYYVVSENTLVMNFVYTDPGDGGRVSGISGDWVFSFERQE
jgi:hypothetical protein